MMRRVHKTTRLRGRLRGERVGGMSAQQATAAMDEAESGYDYNEGLLTPPRVWLTVPLPDRRLSPNGTRNRMERHRLATAARTLAHLTARELLLHTRAPFFGGVQPVTLDVRVSLTKGQRQLDEDNLHGLLKSTLDGLQGWVLQDDRQIHWGAVEWARGTQALVRLTLTAKR